jgi:hypothetical protein
LTYADMGNVVTLRRPPEPRYKGKIFPVWKIEGRGERGGGKPKDWE